MACAVVSINTLKTYKILRLSKRYFQTINLILHIQKDNSVLLTEIYSSKHMILNRLNLIFLVRHQSQYFDMIKYKCTKTCHLILCYK